MRLPDFKWGRFPGLDRGQSSPGVSFPDGTLGFDEPQVRAPALARPDRDRRPPCWQLTGGGGRRGGTCPVVALLGAGACPVAAAAADGEAVVFHFGPGQGGTAAANITRWTSQFTGPDGGPVSPKRETFTVGGLPVTLVELTGTYARAMGAAS